MISLIRTLGYFTHKWNASSSDVLFLPVSKLSGAYCKSTSHIPNIPQPKHSTSQTTHILNIPHPKYPTSQTYHIPNISHPKRPLSPTSHVFNIPHLQYLTSLISCKPNIPHSQHITSPIFHITLILSSLSTNFRMLIRIC